VNSFKAHVKFANKDTTPKTVYLCSTNFDPTVNVATFQNLLSSRFCKKMVVGGSGSANRGTITMFTTIASFGGASNPLVPDYYSGDTSGAAAPANNVWFALGSVCDANDVSGVTYSLDVDIDLDFYEFTTPAT